MTICVHTVWPHYKEPQFNVKSEITRSNFGPWSILDFACSKSQMACYIQADSWSFFKEINI